MSEPARPPVTLVGAGLSGPLMAAYLGQAGYPVHLYERRSDPRKAGASAGRSINLALSRRGLHALEQVGLAEPVRAISIPMRGRMMHPVHGALHFQPYGTEPAHYLNSISRGHLNMLLLDAAEACPGVRVTFDHKAADVDPESGRVVFETPEGRREVETGVLIGADGAFSAVRSAMQRRDRFDYSQDYLEHGYKELTLPASPEGGFRLEPHALHIWPRGSFMMIALPNLDRTFTCTLFWPFEGEPSFASIRGEAAVRGFFEKTFPDAVSLFPSLVAEYAANPVGSLVTVRCRPWHVGGKVVLVGDACHAVVPFYGQGMNAAFEDCTVLMECLREHGPDLEAAFRRYEARRKANTDALADMAIENFVEMRDHVGSGAFLLRKALERGLTRAFPRRYVPLYTMVSFTRIPYAEARRRARAQNRTALLAAAFCLLVVLSVLGFIAFR